MNQAPLLRTFSTFPRLFMLEQKYGAWAKHYESCETCNKQDWYDPFTDLLCNQGRLAVADWKLAAVATPITLKELSA